MCSQDEVRQVIREAATPAWMKLLIALFSAGIFGLLSWLSYSVHNQDADIADRLSLVNLSNARLAGKIGILTTEIRNIREVALTQTKYRSIVVDERCKNMSDRMERMQKTIEKHHRVVP